MAVWRCKFGYKFQFHSISNISTTYCLKEKAFSYYSFLVVNGFILFIELRDMIAQPSFKLITTLIICKRTREYFVECKPKHLMKLCEVQCAIKNKINWRYA